MTRERFELGNLDKCFRGRSHDTKLTNTLVRSSLLSKPSCLNEAVKNQENALGYLVGVCSPKHKDVLTA